MAEIIVPSTIESLDDELFVHVLEQVVSSPKSLGACRAVSLRWRDLSMDDVLWRQVCAGQFGLNQVRAPPNAKAPCTNFYQAARAWFAYRKEFGLSGCPLPEGFADTVTAAHGHWAKLSAWAAVHLPEAKASIGAPASAADWTAFLEWLDLGSTAYAVSTFPGLLQLRVLSSVCNGQQLASDAKMAARHISQSASVEGIEQALEQLALTNGHGGQLSREQSIRESFQGLLGGLSAYDTSLCMRLFPLVVAAAWTQYFRKEQGLPDKLVIAGGSYNLQRLLVVDIETGALLSGPSQSILPDREGVPLTPGQRIYLMRAVPASRASACDLITFMGEHARRVEAGYHLCEPLVPLEPATRGLCLFPQAGPKFSEATTRGVRVTASAVFCAELGMHVYSIRLALLSPSEEGGMTAEERGFETCQLNERHWVLRQSNGEADRVDGAGVVGRFPLLREGGWREDKQDNSGNIKQGKESQGVFIYQSMSGRGPVISFEGEISMVPGSIKQPAGDEFRVRVARFPLTAGADEFLM